MSWEMDVFWIYLLHHNTRIPGLNEPILVSCLTSLKKSVYWEGNLSDKYRSANVRNMETWQKEHISYRKPSSGYFCNYKKKILK